MPPNRRERERSKAREEAGVGIGLADDLRAIHTALIKAHLAQDFEAAFNLVVFQLVRAVFARGYTGSAAATAESLAAAGCLSTAEAIVVPVQGWACRVHPTGGEPR